MTRILSYLSLFLAMIILVSGCVDQPSVRTIQFSGYTWWVKSSETPVGPGPNIFSNSLDYVRVDDQGFLHLKIARKGDHYECAEIISNESFGYGNYVFTLASDPKLLDQEVVLGLFTWDDQPAYFHREIDIEFSRWEKPDNVNAQYVVQPWDYPGNIYRFDVKNNGKITTHSFNWQPDKITFKSYYGMYVPDPGKEDMIDFWEYKGDNNPLPGKENARINLWLANGKAPADDRDSEIVIEQFRFIP